MPTLINENANLVQPGIHHKNNEFVPEEVSVIDEDAFVHGSSVMDEREDVNSPVFDHILDGYAYISSDSDIEIMVQAPGNFDTYTAPSLPPSPSCDEYNYLVG
ncbi:hypothetical protein [Parasitella parasitica]|uniref:Uncharacterized protein n=1 Tax=Parasitella parasitica TaxID=35722 RepID=A0A0B7NFE7_9FUNG|nr:hypothetical protein [Parasitella parasitica]